MAIKQNITCFQQQSVLEKLVHFQTLDLTKFLCSVDFNMAAISSTTHIKTTFSVSPGIAKHFTGNALCSSDDSVTQLIRILRFSR